MRGVVMYEAGDVRVEERPDPVVELPTDAIIRVTATCICGSDLWPYRGHDKVDHKPMGHEYIGVVTDIGDDVQHLAIGDYVVGSFMTSDNTCEICEAGYQSRCIHTTGMGSIGTMTGRLCGLRFGFMDRIGCGLLQQADHILPHAGRFTIGWAHYAPTQPQGWQ